MDIAYILKLLFGFVILVLFGISHLYIQKLEKTGCPCANHPYKEYIKTFTAIAFVYILVMMLIPQQYLLKSTNGVWGVAYAIFSVAFLVATVIFFVYSIKYVQYLVREKCKCSEDIRREILYYWSIAHLIYMGIVVLIPIFILIIGGSMALVMNTTNDIRKKHDGTFEAVTNPFKGIKNVPRKLKDNLKSLKDLSKVGRK
jgi:hypothetical protein